MKSGEWRIGEGGAFTYGEGAKANGKGGGGTSACGEGGLQPKAGGTVAKETLLSEKEDSSRKLEERWRRVKSGIRGL